MICQSWPARRTSVQESWSVAQATTTKRNGSFDVAMQNESGSRHEDDGPGGISSLIMAVVDGTSVLVGMSGAPGTGTGEDRRLVEK